MNPTETKMKPLILIKNFLTNKKKKKQKKIVFNAWKYSIIFNWNWVLIQNIFDIVYILHSVDILIMQRGGTKSSHGEGTHFSC